jgi:hypothetical protein
MTAPIPASSLPSLPSSAASVVNGASTNRPRRIPGATASHNKVEGLLDTDVRVHVQVDK